jgi:divalent metal cation (Fe/Co/Zn/Cd) transporter
MDVVQAFPTPTAGSGAWLSLTRRAKFLSWTSLVWLCIEGSVAVIAGAAAGSIALVGFGLDSAIEGLASVVVIWRFTGTRTLSETAERRAQQLVAASFFLLAPYITYEAVHSLVVGHQAETSWVGAGLAVSTLFVCPWLGLAKRRVGARLGSAATTGEGTQNLLCAGLAVGVLTGILANALLGLWSLDPIVALGIAGVCINEGRRAWQGESVRACC